VVDVVSVVVVGGGVAAVVVLGAVVVVDSPVVAGGGAGVAAVWVVVVDPSGAALPELDVVVGVEVVVVLAVVVAAGVVEAGGFVSSPLFASSASICRCTATTAAAIAAGDPSAPSAGRALSFSSAARSFATSSSEGWDCNVTTIWSAIAVVMHAGQLTFSAPAALTGAIVLLWPMISTTWNDTATVVHARQFAKANALFVLFTGAPFVTVTSEYATL
jgi:hypothetical protein